MKDIILIDAGTGNLRSVQKALEAVGAQVERTDDPHALRRALSGKKVVLPGVGAFGDFMAGLRARGLEDVVKDAVAHGVPLLGICVGMQALFELGEEMGEHKGLGLLEGKVVRFDESLPVKITHTGWNRVRGRKDAQLFRQVEEGAYVYFNHSYYCQPWNSSDVIGVTSHGIEYVCAVAHDNILGVQFHPEKSQAVGLQILKNFVEVA